MMIEIEQPHGYLKDDDGHVILRFANWSIGDHQVPDATESAEYVDGPNAHTESVAEKYKPDMG